MLVKEILRLKGSRLVGIAPGEQATEAVRIMAEENLGSLVVLERQRMVGVLTFRELLQAAAAHEGSLGGVRVAEIMVRIVVSFVLTQDSSIELDTDEDLRRFARRYLVPLVH